MMMRLKTGLSVKE